MPNTYYLLVSAVSLVAGIYIDQNYNVPDIKNLYQYGENVVGFYYCIGL